MQTGVHVCALMLRSLGLLPREEGGGTEPNECPFGTAGKGRLLIIFRNPFPFDCVRFNRFLLFRLDCGRARGSNIVARKLILSNGNNSGHCDCRKKWPQNKRLHFLRSQKYTQRAPSQQHGGDVIRINWSGRGLDGGGGSDGDGDGDGERSSSLSSRQQLVCARQFVCALCLPLCCFPSCITSLALHWRSWNRSGKN